MGDDGLRAHEALRLAIGFGYLGFGAPVRLSDHDRDLHDPTGVRALIDRLLDGAWHATGRRVRDTGGPPSKREVIRSDSWEFLMLNVKTDSASGGGIEFLGLRFYSGAPTSPPKKTAPAENECTAWLINLMATTEKAKKKNQYRDEADDRYEGRLSAKAFNRAWDKASKSERTLVAWKKPGPPSSS